MASRMIAHLMLELAGLPPSAHRRRCLIQVENTVGIGWRSLFPKQRGAEAVVRNLRDILLGIVARQKKTLLQLWAPGVIVLWNNESVLASLLPQPTDGASFFVDWLNLMNGRWWLLERDITNVLKSGSFTKRRWSFHGVLSVAAKYFVFPLFHPDFPPAVNYGGAGRLLADEILRGLYDQDAYDTKLPENHNNCSDSRSSDTPELSRNHVDSKALLASLSAYRLHLARYKSSSSKKEYGLAQDRLFFVASCYALCSSANPKDILYGDASHRCNNAVKALPQFAAVFQCATAE
ncbi:hypothetical protein MRX96_039253 [Rhipicephalus microplus]